MQKNELDKEVRLKEIHEKISANQRAKKPGGYKINHFILQLLICSLTHNVVPFVSLTTYRRDTSRKKR